MRLALRLLSAVLATAVIVGGLAFIHLNSSLPQTSGVVEIPGLQQPATISRNRFGLARIAAGSEHDAYVAMGFLHAQERLWQMEMQRRAGAGRLSEVLGAAALDTDKFMRTLGVYRMAEASLAHLGPEVMAALDAYAKGVNAWIERHGGALPPEFLMLGFSPEPWQPADSIVWARLMGLQLAGNWREELLRARLLNRIPAERASHLWAAYEADAPSTVSLDDAFASAMLAAIPDMARSHLASIVWAVSGARTPSGKPVLANDPHLGFDAPILWFLASISAPGLEVHGATVPGVPFHLLGHNGTIAWGITTTHSDLMDLFVEKPGPEPGTYLAPEGPLPFLVREELIRIKDAAPVTIAVRETRHGPILSDVLGTRSDGQLLALASATLQPEDVTAKAFFLLNRAKNWPQFVDALSFFHSPQQNIAYSDVDGTIGFYSPGLVPIRRKGDGLLPRPGWTGEWDWIGWVPFKDLPSLANPANGRIVNANNQVVPDAYPYLIAAHWPEPYRAMRIIQVLDGADRHGPTDSAILQNDTFSPVFGKFKDLLASLDVKGETARQARETIAAWDGVMRRDRPEPLLFEAWLIAFQQALIADELGDLAGSFRIPRPRFLELALSREPAWCDDLTTPAVDLCPDVAVRAFEVAVAELAQRHGADVATWRWGDRHQAVFEHALFKHVPLLDGMARLTIPTDGGDFTVNRGTFNAVPPELFTHVHGAGLRAIYDLSDLSASRFMIATGQSGNILSKHYDDMLEAWRDGAYVQFSSEEDEDLLTLRPAP